MSKACLFPSLCVSFSCNHLFHTWLYCIWFVLLLACSFLFVQKKSFILYLVILYLLYSLLSCSFLFFKKQYFKYFINLLLLLACSFLFVSASFSWNNLAASLMFTSARSWLQHSFFIHNSSYLSRNVPYIYNKASLFKMIWQYFSMRFYKRWNKYKFDYFMISWQYFSMSFDRN